MTLQLRTLLMWTGVATLGLVAVLMLWWQIYGPSGEKNPSHFDPIPANRVAQTEPTPALLRATPAEELTSAQEKTVAEIDAQLQDLAALSTEWVQEFNRNKVHQRLLNEIHEYQLPRITSLRPPPEVMEYGQRFASQWKEVNLAQLYAWRPLVLFELLAKPDAPAPLHELATALVNNTIYREGLLEHLRVALDDQDLNIEAEGAEGYVKALREQERPLRKKQQAPLGGLPLATHAYLEESSKVFATNHLIALYRQPLEAKQQALSERIGKSSTEIFFKLATLPQGNETRIRLATRLQEILYPPKK